MEGIKTIKVLVARHAESHFNLLHREWKRNPDSMKSDDYLEFKHHIGKNVIDAKITKKGKEDVNLL